MMTPMELGAAFPVRKTNKQKQSFRDALHAWAEEQGYSYREEKGSFGSCNVILGHPEKAEFLVTAHYDTCVGTPFPNFITPCNPVIYILYQLLVVCWLLALPAIPALLLFWLTKNSNVAFLVWYGLLWVNILSLHFGPANKSNCNDNTSGVVTVLEIARSLPQNRRDRVCFVLFDLEEAGLLGSSSYRKAHKQEIEKQLVLNLDCVGNGDHILMLPTRKLKKDAEKICQLKRICGWFGEKSLDIRVEGASVYPSDQKNFPYGVGICALHKGKVGLYMNRIHTKRDTVLEQTNVNILRAALSSLVCCTPARKE